MTSDPAPIYDQNAERALLGCALINPSVEVGTVYQTDFYLNRHQSIWGAILSLSEDAAPIDIITVTNALDGAGQLEDIGGAAYLARLITSVPNSLNAMGYADIVRRDSLRRQLLAQAQSMAQAAMADDADPGLIAARTARQLETLGASQMTGTVIPIGTAVSEWYNEFEDHVTTGNLPGLTTGYPLIDKRTLGLRRKELTILAGRPGMGKTSMAASMSIRQAEAGLKVGVFTLEETKETWIEAAALSDLGINRTTATQDDLERVARKCSAIYHLPLRFYDRGYSSMAEIEQAARTMYLELGGLDVVWTDHLGYVDHGRDSKTTSLPYLIGQTTKRMARMAKDIGCAWVSLCQLSRDSAKTASEPVLTDLRDSGEIEQDARSVWFVHRPGYYATPEPPDDLPQEARLLVRKNSKGPTGLIKLAFVKAYRRFAEWSK